MFDVALGMLTMFAWSVARWRGIGGAIAQAGQQAMTEQTRKFKAIAFG